MGFVPFVFFVFFVILFGCEDVVGQDYLASYGPKAAAYLAQETDELAGLSPDALFGGLDPVVQHWYLPRILPEAHRWRQWDETNWAKIFYQRYPFSRFLGDYWYDSLGRPIRGLLIYDWRHAQPSDFGSLIQGDELMGGLIITGDRKGEYHLSMTIGDQIHTVLTPMTFSKPTFNGIRWDLASNEFTGTFLLSRISSPGRLNIEWRNATHLMGGRVLRTVGSHVIIGGTFLNAHQSNTTLPFAGSNPFTGELTSEQNGRNIRRIQIILSDDSPDDGIGGAALFRDRVMLTDLDGETIRGDLVGLTPLIEGGKEHPGYRTADGNDRIFLTYDFSSRFYSGPPLEEIDHVTFELILANDYRIDVASDRQTDAENAMVPWLIARARGNVQDMANPIVLRFDYGLPTANQILGFTLEVEDMAGIDLQGEWNLNRRYFQYPNRDRKKHHLSFLDASAGYVNLAYRRYPWFAFGELYQMEHDYTTSAFLSDKGGFINYADELIHRYEFVDDNDDYDRYPDWQRGSYDPNSADQAVFPGLDENGDFISDFNQNDNPIRRNFFPDYEEPFLRHSVDRPEYLVGVDMNNNGWIDRFENDDLADYPYKKDREGYNVYFGVHPFPGARAMVGQTRERLIAGHGYNRSTYLVFSMDVDRRIGRWRFFEYLRDARDTIPDDLFQWTQPVRSEAIHRETRDRLFYRDAWVNTAYLEYTYRRPFDLNFTHRMKHEVVRQRTSRESLETGNVRNRSHLFGMIDRVDHTFRLGIFTLNPRWKSEYLAQKTPARDVPARKELRQTLSLIVEAGFARRHKGRVYKSTKVATGIEWTYFNQLADPIPPGREDFRGLVFLVQLTSCSAYMGYRIVTDIGFLVDRQRLAGEGVRATGRGFLTVYAGIQE